MDSSSDEEVLVLACVIEEEEVQERRRKRRFWVHEINIKQEQCGEYHTLFPDLLRDEQKFFKYFRMSSAKFFQLLDLLPLEKKHTNCRATITPGERLAVTLKFLGYADSIATISFSYRMGESTMRAIIHKTCRLISEHLQPLVMPKPTREQWENIAAKFEARWNYPNCLGALDGKHVVFEKPRKSGSLYFNYKHTFSIVLLALVDADCNFITVDVGTYGRQSDGGIFQSSALGRSLEHNLLDIPPPKKLPLTGVVVPHVIVADEAFPLTVNVMRSYPGAQVSHDDAKKIYNYRHCRARRVSENAFGILAKKFQIYKKKMSIDPKNMDFIVLKTVALHNYLSDDRCAWEPGELEEVIVPQGLGKLKGVGENN